MNCSQHHSLFVYFSFSSLFVHHVLNFIFVWQKNCMGSVCFIFGETVRDTSQWVCLHVANNFVLCIDVYQNSLRFIQSLCKLSAVMYFSRRTSCKQAITCRHRVNAYHYTTEKSVGHEKFFDALKTWATISTGVIRQNNTTK